MKNFDCHTRAGREAIDKAVKKALGLKPKSRTEIAEKIGLDPTVASASLKRLVERNEVYTEGERGTMRYCL